jgi:hypothetical protein
MKKLTTILALIAVLMLTVPAFAQAPQFAGVASKARKDVYVVIMAADPAIAYEGDISGLPATKPAKGTKINPNSARVKKYQKFLKNENAKALRAVGARAGAKVLLHHLAQRVRCQAL